MALHCTQVTSTSQLESQRKHHFLERQAQEDQVCDSIETNTASEALAKSSGKVVAVWLTMRWGRQAQEEQVRCMH